MSTRDKYSAFMPDRLHEQYEESLRETDYTLKPEVALIDTRLTDIIGDLATHVPKSFWRNVDKIIQGLEDAHYNGTAAQVNSRIRDLKDAVSEGKREASAWDTIYGLVDLRAKLVKEERREAASRQTRWTLTEGRAIMEDLLLSIHNHIDDMELLTAIQEDFLSIATRVSPYDEMMAIELDDEEYGDSVMSLKNQALLESDDEG